MWLVAFWSVAVDDDNAAADGVGAEPDSVTDATPHDVDDDDVNESIPMGHADDMPLTF